MECQIANLVISHERMIWNHIVPFANTDFLTQTYKNKTNDLFYLFPFTAGGTGARWKSGDFS